MEKELKNRAGLNDKARELYYFLYLESKKDKSDKLVFLSSRIRDIRRPYQNKHNEKVAGTSKKAILRHNTVRPILLKEAKEKYKGIYEDLGTVELLSLVIDTVAEYINNRPSQLEFGCSYVRLIKLDLESYAKAYRDKVEWYAKYTKAQLGKRIDALEWQNTGLRAILNLNGINYNV